jgi:hypothetical protein
VKEELFDSSEIYFCGIYGNTIESVKSNNYNELGARQKSED